MVKPKYFLFAVLQIETCITTNSNMLNTMVPPEKWILNDLFSFSVNFWVGHLEMMYNYVDQCNHCFSYTYQLNRDT